MAKTFFLLLLINTCLVSCYTKYPARKQDKLLNIPTPAHNRDVDIFFQHEAPKEDYLKIKVLEVAAIAETDYNKMIAAAKSKAQNEGLDALIVLNKEEQFIRPQTVPSDKYAPSYYNQSKLAALGLKYRKNLSYLKAYIKAQHVYQVAGDSATKIVVVNYDYDGEEIETKSFAANGTDLYMNQVKKLSKEFLMDSKKYWGYSMNDNRIDKRYYLIGQQVALHCKFKYAANSNLPVQLKITDNAYSGENIKKYTMDIRYDSKGKITQTKVYDKFKRLYEERVFEYRPDELPAGCTIKQFSGTSEINFYTKFEYHSDQDIANMK